MKRTIRVLSLVTICALAFGCGDDGGDGGGGGTLCERGCTETLAADCPNGPSSQAVCVSDCEDLVAGTCSVEYNRLLTCSDGETVDCDGSSGIPVIASCSVEQGNFIACLNQ